MSEPILEGRVVAKLWIPYWYPTFCSKRIVRSFYTVFWEKVMFSGAVVLFFDVEDAPRLYSYRRASVSERGLEVV